jgi:hypothetical protein
MCSEHSHEPEEDRPQKAAQSLELPSNFSTPINILTFAHLSSLWQEILLHALGSGVCTMLLIQGRIRETIRFHSPQGQRIKYEILCLRVSKRWSSQPRGQSRGSIPCPSLRLERRAVGGKEGDSLHVACQRGKMKRGSINRTPPLIISVAPGTHTQLQSSPWSADSLLCRLG